MLLWAKELRVPPCFDGRPATEVLDQIEREHRLRLTTRLLSRLADFGILAEIGEEGASAAGQ